MFDSRYRLRVTVPKFGVKCSEDILWSLGALVPFDFREVASLSKMPDGIDTHTEHHAGPSRAKPGGRSTRILVENQGQNLIPAPTGLKLTKWKYRVEASGGSGQYRRGPLRGIYDTMTKKRKGMMATSKAFQDDIDELNNRIESVDDVLHSRVDSIADRCFDLEDEVGNRDEQMNHCFRLLRALGYGMLGCLALEATGHPRVALVGVVVLAVGLLVSDVVRMLDKKAKEADGNPWDA